MKHLTKLLIACAAGGPLATAAQTPQGESGPGGQYYVHGVFNPVIADAEKLFLDPEPFDSIIPPQPLRYDMLGVRYDVVARVDTIAPAKVNVTAMQERLYRGFIKAGFGLYTTPLGELYYDQTRSRKNGYGIHLKHLSSNGGLNDVGPSDYSNNRMEGFYTSFLPQHEVNGNIAYDRRRVTYYGYDLALFDSVPEPSVDDLEQFYNDIGFGARIRSLYRDTTKIAHAVGMEVHTYGNKAQSRELNLRLTADLGKEDGTETYGLGVLIDNNAYRGRPAEGEDFRQNGTIVGLMPSVSTASDKYTVKVGVGMFIDAMNETTFHFYPNVYASYSLFGDMLVPYIGVDGYRQRNSFRSLTRENPWLIDAPGLANSSLMYDIHGGLRGSFSRDVGFDVRVSGQRWKDKPLYVNEAYFSFGNQFTTVYDRVDILDVRGELIYSPSEAVQVSGRIDIYRYDTDEQPEAWNLPPYEIGLIARYDLREKLILKVEAQFMGRRPVSGVVQTDVTDETTATVVDQELDGFMDLYLGAEYRYNKRLSVFVDVSNLSASKYERWYNYPVQRTLFMGGATYAF